MTEPCTIFTPFENRQSKVAMIIGLLPVLFYDLDDETIDAIYEKVRVYDEAKRKLTTDLVKDVFRI